MSANQLAVSKLWPQAAVLTFLVGFTGLGYLTWSIYRDSPPVPARVVSEGGRALFTAEEIGEGQDIFQRYALMQHGSLFGHGAYLGPDFTAQYLHRAAVEMAGAQEAAGASRAEAEARVTRELKQNRYDPATGVLVFGPGQERAFDSAQRFYADYFAQPERQRGLVRPAITDPKEVRALTSFFAWAAWVSAAARPGAEYSFTNNWPPEPLAGNTATTEAFFWSVMSLIALLAGVGLILYFFGRYDLLGWHRSDEGESADLRFRAPEVVKLTPSQRAIPFYFLVTSGLFLAQGLLGGANAHYHVEPAGFYGFDLAALLPYNLSRTWHVQLALFWVAASFLAQGIFITPMLAGHEPRGQDKLALLLFGAVVIVVVGSLLGEAASMKGWLTGPEWFWVGAQGLEYLDLGRLWQLLLTAGMVIWALIVFRGLRSRLAREHKGNLPYLFFYSALSIPAFYAVGMVVGRHENFAVADFWRFWVVHLWVEDFLELFTTITVAVMFVLLGVVRPATATRVVYLDIILYSVGGVIGTMHHVYFSGAPAVHMAMGAFFSAMEVIPLVLLTVEAWRFVRLGRSAAGAPGVPQGALSPEFPHKWAVMFLIAVGFWNFLGAGIFGFLINLPIVSYWEIGTQLTANHGHGALMGVYGMLALAFFMFVARYFLPATARVEKAMKVSFWSLNIGLAWMLFVNLFPLGALQLADSFAFGYWHAREPEFFERTAVRVIEWLRLPGDILFIVGGIVPVVLLALAMVKRRKRPEQLPEEAAAEPFTRQAG